MNRPRFSVVIPTRQRPRTLEAAIKTCLQQSFDDYEIIVADNNSDPDTRLVVEKFGSAKIRYHRSDTSLPMSANWEVGVTLAAGEYITVIGDDDGILMHCLAHADQLISTHGLSVLSWPWVLYNWPDYTGPEWPHRLSIPLPGNGQIVDAKTVVRQVTAGKLPYVRLPMLYNSFVHRDALTGIRDRCGRLFGSLSPDIYSGFAVAMSIKDFATTGHPMTIAGRHSASNGEACLHDKSLTVVSSEFFKLNEAFGFGWHNSIPPIRWSLAAVVAESFAKARDDLGLNHTVCELDRSMLARRIIAGLRANPRLDDDTIRDALAVIEQFMPDQASLCRKETNGQALQPSNGHSNDRRAERPASLDRLGGASLELLGCDFNVVDCTGVASLVSKLFPYTTEPAKLNLPHSPADRSQLSGSSFLKRAARGVCPPILWRAGQQLSQIIASRTTR